MSPRTAFTGVALLSVAALGAALVSQHVYGMQPCPWCVLQRLIFVLIAIVAAFGIWAAGRPGAGPARAVRVTAGATGLLAVAGAAAALWQHFVAASQASCDLTLADRVMSGLGLDMAWPEVFAPFASCADSKVNLFGVPYEFYSLALFMAFAVASVRTALAWGRAEAA